MTRVPFFLQTSTRRAPGSRYSRFHTVHLPSEPGHDPVTHHRFLIDPQQRRRSRHQYRIAEVGTYKPGRLQFPHPLPFPEVTGSWPLRERQNYILGPPQGTSPVPDNPITRVPRAPNNPTTSRLLAILASYPNLQQLFLYNTMIPRDDGDGSTSRVSLCHLNKLKLLGNCRRVFRLLDWLDCPDMLDSVYLHLSECPGECISEQVEPYLRCCILRDDRFKGRLEIKASCTRTSISFGLNAFGEFNIPTMPLEHGYPSIVFSVVFKGMLPPGAGEKLSIDLIGATPRDRVVKFTGEPSSRHAIRDLLATMPNLESL